MYNTKILKLIFNLFLTKKKHSVTELNVSLVKASETFKSLHMKKQKSLSSNLFMQKFSRLAFEV